MMMRMTNEERTYLMIVSDFALSSSKLLLEPIHNDDGSSMMRCDDDVLSLLSKYFNKAFEQEADVGHDYCTNEKSLTRYLSMIMTEHFLTNLEVGQDYSTGFQVIMTIQEIVRDETSNKVLKFRASDNEEEHPYWISRGNVMMNMESQIGKTYFRYFPILYKNMTRGD